MELTVDQALQQGVAAHKEGKLEDAERLYRAILQSQPTHPDANHNLGVLAVSVGKADAALPLFKTALEANSKIEQFWVSYIDALIKTENFDDAKQVLEQAKKQGVKGEKLDVLETQLTPTAQVNEPKLAVQKKSLSLPQKRKKLAEQKKQKKAKKQNLKGISPSQAEINNLLRQYQTGLYGDAEKLALSITERFPEHEFGWKALGAILSQTGRFSESLVPNQKSVQLAPQDAEAHSNLGNTLKELGRLDEADASCRQAITLKPDFAEAHNNLGVALQKLGRLEEAEASYTQAIVLKPGFALAHNNLGNTLKELGRLDEAEVSLRQAIAVKADNAEAHYNLGVFFFEVNEYEKAAEQFNSSSYKLSKSYLLRCLYKLDVQSRFFDELDYLINQGEVNSIIGSLGCRSVLKYGLERPNLFCKDPLKYVLHTDLNSKYDFEKIFAEKVRFILNENKISYRKTLLLINGYQTSGNLFDIKSDYTIGIQKVIQLEIEKYRIHFKNSEEGLIKNWPTDYSINGWLISLKNGGELRPHMHEKGWISGSIYVNVPPKSKADSGNLVVCIDDEETVTERRKNSSKSINVVTGNLVLFPASLMHYTIPFKSEEERIVLAFDIIPK
jgi:tetratricopeptide (TPR) repeat protein